MGVLSDLSVNGNSSVLGNFSVDGNGGPMMQFSASNGGGAVALGDYLSWTGGSGIAGFGPIIPFSGVVKYLSVISTINQTVGLTIQVNKSSTAANISLAGTDSTYNLTPFSVNTVPGDRLEVTVSSGSITGGNVLFLVYVVPK